MRPSLSWIEQWPAMPRVGGSTPSGRAENRETGEGTGAVSEVGVSEKLNTVGVAQLVEHRTVAARVAGSTPVAHPKTHPAAAPGIGKPPRFVPAAKRAVCLPPGREIFRSARWWRFRSENGRFV